MSDKKDDPGNRAKEDEPIYNKFHSNAEDVVFSRAPPLTDAQKRKAAAMWDALAIESSPPERVPTGENDK